MAIIGKMLRVGLFLGIFLIALLSGLFFTSKWIVQNEAEVVVPDLVGHDTVYALDLLTSLGLNIKVSGFEWSDSVPKNFIAFQDPAPGVRLKRDRDVKVVLSRGSRTVRMPNVVGVRLQEAVLVLSQNGLQQGGICRVFSQRYPRNIVMAQSPAALGEIERGRPVDLLVSKGPRPPVRAMPELRHQSVSKALLRLKGLGLTVAAIQEVHSPGEPLNVIVSQRPVAGYRVTAATPITLQTNRSRQRPEQRPGLLLISYLVPEGYFKKEITVFQQIGGKTVEISRGIHQPGELLQWLVWARSPQEVSIYADGVHQLPEGAVLQQEGIGRLYMNMEEFDALAWQ
ncbi:MAG: PASTA domain-containing protein [Deltaproteobacteria bacterium]|nr:PASTA domain-containing protein [Deltaproteobacteria bacterium]MBW2069684.1 PASTA domain-containing protein [Deltaproteobacteria bacterium]